MINQNEREWNIALEGLRRFYDEGMVNWSKDQFVKLFSSKEVAESEYIQQALHILKQEKCISLVKNDESYMIMHGRP